MDTKDIVVLQVKAETELPPFEHPDLEMEIARDQAQQIAYAIVERLKTDNSIQTIESKTVEEGGRKTLHRRVVVGFVSTDSANAKLAGSILDAELRGMRRAADLIRASAARYDGRDGPCGFVIADALRSMAARIREDADALSRKPSFWRPMTSTEHQWMSGVEYLYEDGTISERPWLRKIVTVSRELMLDPKEPLPTVQGEMVDVLPIAWRGKLRRG